MEPTKLGRFKAPLQHVEGITGWHPRLHQAANRLLDTTLKVIHLTCITVVNDESKLQPRSVNAVSLLERARNITRERLRILDSFGKCERSIRFALFYLCC